MTKPWRPASREELRIALHVLTGSPEASHLLTDIVNADFSAVTPAVPEWVVRDLQREAIAARDHGIEVAEAIERCLTALTAAPQPEAGSGAEDVRKQPQREGESEAPPARGDADLREQWEASGLQGRAPFREDRVGIRANDDWLTPRNSAEAIAITALLNREAAGAVQPGPDWERGYSHAVEDMRKAKEREQPSPSALREAFQLCWCWISNMPRGCFPSWTKLSREALRRYPDPDREESCEWCGKPVAVAADRIVSAV